MEDVGRALLRRGHRPLRARRAKDVPFYDPLADLERGGAPAKQDFDETDDDDDDDWYGASLKDTMQDDFR